MIFHFFKMTVIRHLEFAMQRAFGGLNCCAKFG